MPAVETSGPKHSQIVFYQDGTYGKIPAIITAINATNGTISVTTFPPGVAPQWQTNVQYDNTGVNIGSWRYPEVAVQ